MEGQGHLFINECNFIKKKKKNCARKKILEVHVKTRNERARDREKN